MESYRPPMMTRTGLIPPEVWNELVNAVVTRVTGDGRTTLVNQTGGQVTISAIGGGGGGNPSAFILVAVHHDYYTCVSGEYANWESGQDYVIGDTVVHDYTYLICILDHTSSAANEPPNATYWEDVLGIDIAKAAHLRRETYHDKTIDGYSFNYTDVDTRVVTLVSVGTAQTQEIRPKLYLVSDVTTGDAAGYIIEAIPAVITVRNDADDADVACSYLQINAGFYSRVTQ